MLSDTGTATDWFPNGVDSEKFSPGDEEYDPNAISFIGDVLLALNMTVGNAVENLNADVSPTRAFGTAQIILGDGSVDVQDVLLLLRVVVGLDALAGGVDVDSAEALAAVRAAHFVFDGFWVVLGGALSLDGEDPPPLNTPTTSERKRVERFREKRMLVIGFGGRPLAR